MARDLICEELKGRNFAIASYVDILWKIRSGYVIVLGALVSLSDKLGGEKLEWTKLGLTSVQCASILLISVLGFLLDVAYVYRKGRVIRAYHDLTERALDHAPDKSTYAKGTTSEHPGKPLLELLEIAGEPKRTEPFEFPQLLYLAPFAGWLLFYFLWLFWPTAYLE